MITNRQRWGKDFYQRIGAKGGRLGTTGGFASDVVGPDGLTGRERARLAGTKGGKASRRNVTTERKLAGKAEKIKEMYLDNLSMRDIARKLDLPYGSVRYYIKKEKGLWD